MTLPDDARLRSTCKLLIVPTPIFPPSGDALALMTDASPVAIVPTPEVNAAVPNAHRPTVPPSESTPSVAVPGALKLPGTTPGAGE